MLGSDILREHLIGDLRIKLRLPGVGDARTGALVLFSEYRLQLLNCMDLLRIAVDDADAVWPPFGIDDVDCAPVRERRDGKSRLLP
jgi:hypothetical protein